MVTFQCSWMKV